MCGNYRTFIRIHSNLDSKSYKAEQTNPKRSSGEIPADDSSILFASAFEWKLIGFQFKVSSFKLSSSSNLIELAQNC